MEVDGLSVDDVFRQCVFKKDEREMVLRAVRLVHPEYQPSVSKDQPVCSLPLVKQFYAEVPLHYVTLYYKSYTSKVWDKNFFLYVLKNISSHHVCIYLTKKL